jgi:putative hemolysin
LAFPSPATMASFPLLSIIAIGLLVMANAFFSAAEFALITARRTWLQQKAAHGDARAEAALKLVNDLNAVTSAAQVGITMTSLGLGWIGETTIASLIEPGVASMGTGSAVVIHTIALVVSFAFITFLHVVIGELVPKQVALGRAEAMSLVVAWPMTIFLNMFRVPMAIFNSASFAFARHLGAKAEGGHSIQFSTAEELKLLVSAGYGTGAVPEFQQEMIHRVIDLDDVVAREVMVPRPNIVSVPVTLSLDELLRLVTEDQHSRIPVYEGSPEQIIGVLYTKDLLKVWEEERRAATRGAAAREFSLRSLVRELIVVPETKPIDQLLQLFQQRRRHMAIVVDEFGSVVGLVTVEDVLEQIVGEIEDEYDWEIPPGLQLGDDTLVLDARVSILDLENQYDLELPRDTGFETLAGFVLQQLGHIPQPGESFVYGSRRFTVLAMDHHRIARVKVEQAA